MIKHKYFSSRLTRYASIEYVLIVVVVIWTAVLSTFSIARHERMNSTAYDLAIKSQVIWNSGQGRLFASTLEVEHYLGDHVQPIMLLLAPLYRLWPDVRLLLFIQALALSLGAFAVYKIACRHLQHKHLALTFAIVYLLYPAIGFMNRFDFHPIVFTIPLFLFAFNAWEEKRFYLTSLFLFLALMTKEEAGITVFMVGLYALFTRKQTWFGSLWAITGLTWSLLALFVIIPSFRGGDSDTLSRYAWLGADASSQVITLLTKPGFVWQHQMSALFRQQFLSRILLPLGFLSLLNPVTLLIGVPAILYNFLSDVPSQSSIYFHYIAPFIPFAFIAAILGVAWLSAQKQGTSFGRYLPHAAITLLCIGTIAAWLLDNPFTKPIDEPYYPVYTLERPFDRQPFDEAASLLPPDASVATTMAFAPHLSTRPELYLFYHKGKRGVQVYDYPQADYLLLHLTDMRWWINPKVFYAMIETAVGRDGYEAIYYRDDVALLHRTGSSHSETGTLLERIVALEEAGGKFAPTAPDTSNWIAQQWYYATLPANSSSQTIEFENGMTLIGYRQHTQDTIETGNALCVTLFWQIDEPITTAYNIFVHLNAPDGYVQAQRDTTGVLGFSPSSNWPSDTVIGDLHCLTIPSGLPPGTYNITAGAYRPDNGERLSTIKSETTLIAPGAPLITQINIAAP